MVVNTWTIKITIKRTVASTIFSSNMYGTPTGVAVRTLIEKYQNVSLLGMDLEDKKKHSI